MEMVFEWIDQVWKDMFPKISWNIVLMVVFLAYMIRAQSENGKKFLPFLNRFGLIVKILTVTLPVSITYTLLTGLSAANLLSSYIIAIGGHSLFIKPIERLFNSKI